MQVKQCFAQFHVCICSPVSSHVTLALLMRAQILLSNTIRKGFDMWLWQQGGILSWRPHIIRPDVTYFFSGSSVALSPALSPSRPTNTC